MTRRHFYWKLSCLLVVLACMSTGYAQDSARKILKKVPVSYPLVLKVKGIGGTVRLKVFVKPDGSVRETEVLGGSAILAESAQKSVSQWKYNDGNLRTLRSNRPAGKLGLIAGDWLGWHSSAFIDCPVP